MANSEETMMMSTDQDMFDMEDVVHELDDHHPHSLSRLSMCNTTHKQEEEGEEDDDNNGGGGMTMYMSRLSIESFDGDADEEFSDEKEGQHLLGGLSSDSDKEEQVANCYSLPSTPRPGQRRKNQFMAAGVFKEYASENEVVQKGLLRKKTSRRCRINRRRMVTREKWGERSSNWENSTNPVAMEPSTSINTNNFSHSGESDQQGAGLLVITRPKGGRRSLCMDMEEVKACNDLGFELEHERMLEIPSGISLSASTLDTSSGGNSPIASWRISSPGDDPRDVKARLKVWAQAVAHASTSK